MKLKILLLFTLFLLPGLIQAQNEQLQREIRIAEGILQELFQENLEDEAPFFVFRSNQVTSDYIPGYGVHFILGNSLWTSNSSSARVVQIARSGNTSTMVRGVNGGGQNSNGDDDSDVDPVTFEELENNMIEYFTQYASLLKNLPDNEHIRLSTGLNSSIGRVLISVDQGDRNYEFPKITKWVSKSDVMEFQSGRINENQFTQQIQTADLSEVSEKRDFNIFQSILTTSMQEADFEQLRVRSASSYTYLPGFGIQFNVNANTRGSGPFGTFFTNIAGAPEIDFDVNVDVRGDISRERNEQIRREIEQREETRLQMDSIRLEMDSMRIEAQKTLDSLQVTIGDVANVAVSLRNAFAEEQEPIDPELLESDKNLLYNEIERAILDYGSTLSSLPDDEFIIVSVNWSTRESTLPERTYIRLKKNQLSRGDALEIQEVQRSE